MSDADDFIAGMATWLSNDTTLVERVKQSLRGTAGLAMDVQARGVINVVDHYVTHARAAAPPPVVPPREPGEPWVCVDCGLVETEAATMPTCGMKRRPHIWGAPEKPFAEPPQPSGGARCHGVYYVLLAGSAHRCDCAREGGHDGRCGNRTSASASPLPGEGLLERAAKLLAALDGSELTGSFMAKVADWTHDYRASRSAPKEAK